MLPIQFEMVQRLSLCAISSTPYPRPLRYSYGDIMGMGMMGGGGGGGIMGISYPRFLDESGNDSREKVIFTEIFTSFLGFCVK